MCMKQHCKSTYSQQYSGLLPRVFHRMHGVFLNKSGARQFLTMLHKYSRFANPWDVPVFWVFWTLDPPPRVFNESQANIPPVFHQIPPVSHQYPPSVSHQFPLPCPVPLHNHIPTCIQGGGKVPKIFFILSPKINPINTGAKIRNPKSTNPNPPKIQKSKIYKSQIPQKSRNPKSTNPKSHKNPEIQNLQIPNLHKVQTIQQYKELSELYKWPTCLITLVVGREKPCWTSEFLHHACNATCMLHAAACFALPVCITPSHPSHCAGSKRWCVQASVHVWRWGGYGEVTRPNQPCSKFKCNRVHAYVWVVANMVTMTRETTGCPLPSDAFWVLWLEMCFWFFFFPNCTPLDCNRCVCDADNFAVAPSVACENGQSH